MKKTQKKKKTAPATPDAYEFLNRELSWLEFNQRVLLEACNPKVPLLERLKFLSITASNLDEFCMVRVGGLKMLVAANIRRTDPSGMTPRQQLVAFTRRMRKMVADQYELLEVLSKELAKHGFVIQESVEDLSDEQRKWLEREFMDNIFPLLSPVGVGEERPFRPAGLLSHCVATLAPTTPDEASRMVFIPLGPKLPRFIRIPDADGRAVFIPIEQVVAWQVAAVVEGQSVVECVPFRVTRNADIELREDLSSDLLAGMQELLDDRRETECIRLEIHCRATRALVGAMKQQLGLEQADVYLVDGPVELRSLMSVTQTDGFEDLRDEPWEPVPSPDVDIKESMFPQIAQGDILLVHPYDSFDPVVKLLNDAADDPQVLAIKQVLYRTASQSAIVEALIRAAQVGKRHRTHRVEGPFRRERETSHGAQARTRGRTCRLRRAFAQDTRENLSRCPARPGASSATCISAPATTTKRRPRCTATSASSPAATTLARMPPTSSTPSLATPSRNRCVALRWPLSRSAPPSLRSSPTRPNVPATMKKPRSQ